MALYDYHLLHESQELGGIDTMPSLETGEEATQADTVQS